MSQLAERAEAVLKTEREQAIAMARRDAVLSGLAGLGYEVSEGVATAWVREGRVVLRNVNQPGYGLELGGDGKSARIQARAVAFRDTSALRDSSRDKAVETIWCQALDILGADLRKAGGGVTIERAVAPGQEPLKVVQRPTETLQEDHADEAPSQQTRQK